MTNEDGKNGGGDPIALAEHERNRLRDELQRVVRDQEAAAVRWAERRKAAERAYARAKQRVVDLHKMRREIEAGET